MVICISSGRDCLKALSLKSPTCFYFKKWFHWKGDDVFGSDTQLKSQISYNVSTPYFQYNSSPDVENLISENLQGRRIYIWEMKDHAERKTKNRTIELGFTVNLKSFLQIPFYPFQWSNCSSTLCKDSQWDVFTIWNSWWCGVLALPLSPKKIWQVGTKVLRGWRRVSTSHRLGCGRWGWDGRQASCLSPPASLHETREQIEKWCPEALKGNRGSMSQIDQSMSREYGVRYRTNYQSWDLESNKLLRKEIKKQK